MISALCSLMARGALVSLFVVVFVLPSLFMVFDRVICATSMGFKNRSKIKKNVKQEVFSHEAG